MRRKYFLMILLVLIVVGCIASQWSLSGDGNDPMLPKGDSTPKKTAVDPLPIRQIVLFDSGLAYFQREGQVQDNATIRFAFARSDINDLLKSLVLEDQNGGRVGVVSYESQAPIDKILQSFALDLSSNPTFGEILNQARGEEIEITFSTNPNVPEAKVSGTIIGMETRASGKNGNPGDFLNLSGADGIKSIELERVRRVRFLDPALENDFQAALKVLAAAHDVQKKSVSVNFAGKGPRQVRLGYVFEQPIWKMTYRLRMDPKGKVFLQGWALIDNATDTDWKDVNMTLVSGKPISFEMDLYQPLYVPRPKVEPELFASLRPPVDSGNIALPNQINPGNNQMGPGAGCAGFNIGGGFNFGGGFNMGGGFNFQGGQLDPFGTLPGVTSPMLGNRYQQHWNNLLQKQYAQSIQDKQRLTYQELQKRRAELKRAQKEAREVGGKVAGMNFQQGVESVATAGDFGEFHQFHIREDVTLGRQRSAMLPVFQANIEGEKVSIYNAAVHKRHPLLAVKIKNTSGHPLPQGPVTIYDSKLYAGDSRLLNVQPDDSRILSYAMDLKTKVYRRYETVPGPEMTFRIGSSQFTARYKKIKTTTYVVKNTTAQPHTVILEHPISKELRLVKPNGMVKRSENNYRFEVTAKAKDSVTFKVVEEEFRLDPVALTKRDGQPYYSVASGIEVKPIKKLNEPVIVGVKTSKGLLQRKVRTRETTTYYIQNNSRIDRTFKIDHVIRPDWELVLGENKTKAGPAVERYVLKVEAGKTGVQNLIEDFHKWESGSAVDNIPQQVIRQLINLSVTSKEVKAALQKVLTLKKEEAAISQKLRIKEAELRDLSTEQTRRRSSLKVIPQNDPSYKAFLKRFIEQEQHIEQLLQEVLSLRLSEARKQEELESKLKGMTAQ